MASKKPVRKAPSKKPIQSKTIAKKKTVTKKGQAKPAPKSTGTKKKTKAALGKQGTGVTKKATKVAKATAKKKTPAKAVVGKKKIVTKKAVSKKAKAAPKKNVLKTVSKPKALAKKKVSTPKKKTSIAKNKVKVSPARKPVKKAVKPSAPTVRLVPKAQDPLLTSTERYNIGGLFACAMERRHDPDWSRLRAVLRHLDLSSQEKDNLIRLSEGFMIPKLFAESLPEPKVNQLLADLVKFGMKQGNYEKHWREEIQQIGFWLGVFPAQFQALEHQAKR